MDRDALGRKVREAWVAWAREQPDPKPSWLLPWERLAEPDREVDRRIGEALFRLGREAGIRAASNVATAAAEERDFHLRTAGRIIANRILELPVNSWYPPEQDLCRHPPGHAIHREGQLVCHDCGAVL